MCVFSFMALASLLSSFIPRLLKSKHEQPDFIFIVGKFSSLRFQIAQRYKEKH